MRKIGASDLNINTALIIGAAVGAYFFILKPILEKTGIKKTAAEEAEEKAEHITDCITKIYIKHYILNCQILN
jgi:hypothetical protein